MGNEFLSFLFKLKLKNGEQEVKDQLYHIDLVNNLTHNEYLYKEYEKRKDKLNLFTNDLEDILSNEWFTEILPESWKDPNKIAAPCKKICTKYDK